MTLRRLRMLMLGALLCAAGAASAHRFHAGITDISLNARTGSTEVVHTYMAHDVEGLLANMYQRQFDLSDPDDQAVLRKYVEKQFWLQGRDQRRLPLQWVGMTADAQSVTIFQEAEKTTPSDAVLIHDEVMIDFIADQVNTVNVKEGGAIRTFIFQRSATEHTLK